MITKIGLNEASTTQINAKSYILSQALLYQLYNMQHELTLIGSASAMDYGLKTNFLGLVKLLHTLII